jgi:hypothetical protein
VRFSDPLPAEIRALQALRTRTQITAELAQCDRVRTTLDELAPGL